VATSTPAAESRAPAARSLVHKRAFALHGRLGAWLALPLAFVALTGSLAVYARTLDAWVFPSSVCAHARRGVIDVPWSALEASATRAVPGSHVLTLVAPEEDGASAWALVEGAPRAYRHVFLDPHDGRALGVAPFRTPRRLLRDLHRAWLLGENVGLFPVTALAFVLAASVWTGLRFWSRRGAGGAGRRYHRLASVALLPFLAVLVITGGWYFGEHLFGMFELRPSGALPSLPPALGERVRAREATLGTDALVETAQRAYPELAIHVVALPTPRRPFFAVSGHAGETSLVRELANEVFVQPYTGEVLEVRRARDLGPLAWWEHSVDAIHFGTWGSIVDARDASRALTSVLGVATTALILAGAGIRRARLGRRPRS
jgi:uncharacterized iron-regulated membrane protein